MKKMIKIILAIILIVLIIILFTIKTRDQEIISDKEIILSQKEDTIYTSDKNYNVYDNIIVEPSNTKVICDNNKIIVGENSIKCSAKNKTGEKETEFKVIYSNTYEKTAIFFGDSITAGFGSRKKGYSWAEYIENNYDMKKCVNAGISDYRVSTYDDPKKWLVSEVKSHYNDETMYDFIIMQGGINDVLYNTPLGEISSSYYVNDFDQNTFAGGLEQYIYYVKDKWKDAKIGYIITYFTPKYTERNHIWSFEDYKKYNDLTKKILKKWNIPYLDLFEGEYESKKYSEIIMVNERKYLPDYLHLNDEGYNLVSPYIYKFMQSID